MHHRGTEATEKKEEDQLSRRVIGLAIEVHRTIGPGLLESAYEECLCRELELAKIPFQRQAPLPLSYKGVYLECGYRLDLLVDNALIIEIKSVEKLLPIHDAQLLTYLRLARVRTGLLLNFTRWTQAACALISLCALCASVVNS